MLKKITLGSTGIITPQNAFGALPIQRIDKASAVALLRRAFEGGMTFFDTARAYSDSEEKLGEAFFGLRDRLTITSKTTAVTPEGFWSDLETTLKNLRTDHIDIYQFHNVARCYRPGDGTGMYECMEKAKKQGKILHIGITSHKIGIAEEIIASGLYETLQFPFSYLSSERDIQLTKKCLEKNMGFIAMKGLAGGLIRNSKAAFAFMSQFENVVPIWGVQRENELDEWLALMSSPSSMTDDIAAFIESERKSLSGDFCRGCGYCMPCPQGIAINQAARMSLMLRRAPSAELLEPPTQAIMKKVESCLHCGKCMKKCPYELNTPALLEKNYEDYKRVLSGELTV